MFNKESGLSKYAKVLLTAQFSSTDLLDGKKFLKFVNQRGFNISINELEYYDRIGLIRPIIRLKRPKIQNFNYIYDETGIFALQYYYTLGLIELPTDGDYQNWSNYNKEIEDICLYYHPYQIIQIANLSYRINCKINPSKIDKVNDTELFFKSIKESHNKSITSAKERSLNLIPLIGLLILLDEAYGPLVKTKLSFNPDLSNRNNIQKWRDWKSRKFSPNKVLLLCGTKVEKIKEWYGDLASYATTIDPLQKWFMLQQIIKNSHRYALKDKALLAQDYYAFLYVLGSYIFDLTGEIMFDPDDHIDNERGKWKKQMFGDPFDYSNRITQNKIIKYFMIDSPPELGIIVEGQTEEDVMNLILNEIEVDREKDGFFIHNIEGQDKLRHIKPLLHLSRIIELIIFIIIDNDKDWNKKLKELKVHADKFNFNLVIIDNDRDWNNKFEQLKVYANKSREIIVRKWNKDFEDDNFGINLVLEKVNEILIKNNLTPLVKSNIKSEMKKTNEVLMTTVRNIVKKNDWLKIEKMGKKIDEILSKPHIGKLLIQKRLNEIRNDRYSKKEWNPTIPIEIIMKDIFSLIPKHYRA
ncbi:MAG: TOPRIM nucleotidyl transferase/hydrolase domain-containing protein [Nitrososphaeraceae archaeon]